MTAAATGERQHRPVAAAVATVAAARSGAHPSVTSARLGGRAMSLITYGALAELAEAMSLPSAAHLRESAVDELIGDLDEPHDLRTALDAVREVLESVPCRKEKIKHSDTCWQTHAPCLADKLLDGMP